MLTLGVVPQVIRGPKHRLFEKNDMHSVARLEKKNKKYILTYIVKVHEELQKHYIQLQGL